MSQSSAVPTSDGERQVSIASQAREESIPPRTADVASLVALIVLVALSVVSPWIYGGVSSGVTLVISAIAIVVPLLLVLSIVRKGRSLPVLRPLWPAFAFLALAAIQLLPLPRGVLRALAPGSARVWYPMEPAAAAVLGDGPRPISINPPASRRALALAGGVITLALLAAPALCRRRYAVASVLAVGAGAFAVTLYALLAPSLFGRRLYGVLEVPTVSPYGPFVSKNHFAGYVEVACLLLFGLTLGWVTALNRGNSRLYWVESRRASGVVLTGAAACTLAVGVLASFSRGGAVSLAAGAVVLVVAHQRTGRDGSWASSLLLFGLAAVLGTALVLALPASGRARLRRLPQAGEERAGAFRLRVWHDSLRLARSSPLVGFGLGSFSDAFPYFKSGSGELRVENAENEYLQIMGETGCLGLVCTLGAVFLVVRELRRSIRTSPDLVQRGLAIGALGALSAVAVHSAVDFNLRIPSNALQSALLPALAGGIAFSFRPCRRWGLLTIAGGLSAALCLITYESVLAPSPPEVRQPLRPGLRLAQVESALREALERRPADAEAWVTLGWVRYARGEPLEGVALARYGASLDPTREALQTVAARLAGATGS